MVIDFIKQAPVDKTFDWSLNDFASKPQKLCDYHHITSGPYFEMYVSKKNYTDRKILAAKLADCIPKYQNYNLCFDNWFTSYSFT